MGNIADLRIARDMKYTALYWNLRYYEVEENIFIKQYQNNTITIYAEEQYANLGKLTIVNGDRLYLNSHKSFVVLECIDKLLNMGYTPSEIIVDLDNEYDIYCKNLYIKCFEWNHMDLQDEINIKSNTFLSIRYESRLVSGVIERKTRIKDFSNEIYKYGVFELEQRQDFYNIYNKEDIKSDDFIIDGDKAVKYIGTKKIVSIPFGITEIASCAFWDNQSIEEVIIPDTVVNLGGDTFYNCKNLRRIVIPKSVRFMGNNPFAGCPNLNLANESPYFKIIDGALMNKEQDTLIYYPINNQNKEYYVLDTIKIIGKHTFFICDNLELIHLPKSLLKMENNPFSGCSKLKLDNKSSNYHIIDDVIYDKFKTSVCGSLNSINIDCLTLLPVKKINRNSFWNCKGIRKIILPETLEDIGYNPFVGCSNIEFVSNTPYYKVINGVLYNKNMSKLICYPGKLAVGDIHIPDSVTKLERGAFSGCNKMTSINLHNVNTISKTCFTNCDSLEKVYCSDLVNYIGEWAFAHCNNLQEVSVYKDCFIDNNAFINTNAKLIRRDSRSNYVIESDNLFTLKSMQESYFGKIDSILIDPPYNSHIDYIGYKDGNYDEGYYNFISERLSLAYNLLSPNGFLVINIDEGEVKGLTALAKDIFGKKNVFVFKWKKLHPKFDTNRDVNPNKKNVLYEYIILCKKNQNASLNPIMQPYFDGDVLKEKEASWPNIWDCFGTTSSAKDELQEIFGDRKAFSTPKPVKLIKEFVRATTNKDSIVLDFFAGSGTVGQAVIELNQEDNGNRKVILISNNESNICKDITVKRLESVTNDFEFLY